MTRPIRTIAVAVSFVVVAASASRAGDLCISSGGNLVLAGRKFALPGKDKCKPIAGINNFTVCSGVACTAADGTFVRVHYTCAEEGIIVLQSFSYTFSLPLPSSNIGVATFSTIDNGTPGGFSFPAGTYQLAPCTKPYLPVQ